MDLRAMVNKHKQMKKINFRNYGRNNKELNALIEKKFKGLLKTRKGGKQKKNFSTFNKYRFPTIKVKKASPSFVESMESREISASSS